MPPIASTICIEDLLTRVQIPENGITSTSLSSDDAFRCILFGFDAGQELSEHTASVPAVIQILRGEGDVTLGDAKYDATPGFWAHMPASLPHSIKARTPLVMLLIMAGKPE
jgi:quercetin dioxygenase-like cupin family protein